MITTKNIIEAHPITDLTAPFTLKFQFLLGTIGSVYSILVLGGSIQWSSRYWGGVMQRILNYTLKII